MFSIGLGIAASLRPSGGTPTPTPAPSVSTITPSGSYVSGTEGSGGAAPTASATIFGSGTTTIPTLHFSVFKGEDVYSTDTVLAYASTSDDGGISYVEFSVEGGTPVQVTQMIQHPNNPRIFGFPIRVNMNGRGFLYARVRPVNGRERVISLLIRGCGNTSPTIVREYYVDRINGNDAWDGKSATFTSGSNGPWRTCTKALNSDGVGADFDLGTSSTPNFRRIISGRRRVNLIQSGEHEYDIGQNGAGLAGGARVENKDKLIIRRAPGNTGDTWISKVNRGSMNFAYDWMEFQGVGISVQNVPTSGIGSISNSAGFPVDSIALTQGSKIFHPDGAAGTITYGYVRGRVPGDGGYVPGIFNKGNYFAIAESDVDCPDPCGGLRFVRASRGRYTGFAGHYTDSRQSGTCFWDVRWTQYGGGEGRSHDDYELTVNTAVYNSGANETTITLVGTPVIEDQGPFSFGTSEYYMRALTGPKVGGGGKNDSANLAFTRMLADGSTDPTTYSYPPKANGTTDFDTAGWKIKSQNNTTKTIVVFGDASGILNGNLIRCYYLGHPDCLAIYGCDNTGDAPTAQHRNLLYQNVMFLGHTQTTPWLNQSYAAPFQANGAVAVTISVTSGSTSFSYSGVQASSQLRAGDFVRNKATGEVLRIRSIDTGTGLGGTSGTGTFWTAAAATWTSAASTFCRAPEGVSLINYVSHKQTIDATNGQWDYSSASWSVRCCTFVGRTAQNQLILWGTTNGTLDDRSCFGLTDITFGSCIVQAMTRDSGTGAIPGLNYPTTRNHTISLALSNSVVASADGAPTFPTNFTSYLTTTTKKAAAADVLQVPWDIDGNPRTAGVSSLGAKVA